MVAINPTPANLSPNDVSLFYAADELLSDCPVLIFFGPTSTTKQTNGRVQAHVFTPAGIANFHRIILSPTATFYNAVNCLTREEQGDEICRGLAFSLYKYFVELPVAVKDAWEKHCNSGGRMANAPPLFSDAHAAVLAGKMVEVENASEIIADVRHALGEQTLSWVDLDVVLPQGSIQKLDAPRESAHFDESEEDMLQQRYGQYAKVVKLFGEPAFLPTSKLRRAPSKPTAINRTQTFSRKQKENLRREMCELLDTEENYVGKVYDLLHNVADDFRGKAKHKSLSSSSPDEHALESLFPPSLDEILAVNVSFLDEIRTILEETENEAIQDIETANDDIFVAPLRGQKDPADVTGALAVAKALVEWFPRFADCYTDYISAHANFSQLLKGFTKDTSSSFSRRVQETGEQRLMSMLIEPVQRLPRYNLYIDNIVKQLPLRHPALRPFLKARDIISEICSREAPAAKHIKLCNRLRKIVFSWPPSFNPHGRLITAIDFVELSPPFYPEKQSSISTSGVFLLFSDFLVMLHKPHGCTMTARSILADVDNPKLVESASGSTELLFHQQIKLCDVSLSEHSDGRVLQLISPVPASVQSGRPRSHERQKTGIRMFALPGPYEGKAHKWVEEVTKAKVEGRFPESEREGFKWEVRSVTGDLNLFSSVSEDAPGSLKEGRGEPAKIQILVDPSKYSEPVTVGQQGVEVVATISLHDDDFFHLQISGCNGYSTKDTLTNKEFLPVLTKRLGNFFQIRNHIKNPDLCEAFLLRNQQVLKSLRVELKDYEGEGGNDGKPRPHSPVKVISAIFGGSVGKELGGSRKLQRNPPSLGGIPRVNPLQAPISRTQSREGELSRPSSSDRPASSSTNTGLHSSSLGSDPFAKLEESLSFLILAIQHRKGNIVGRSVRARATANELAVNELYNAFLENPTSLEQAAQASVDVLFAAFEKFIKIAWREKMGPVISPATFTLLQQKSDSGHPGEFEELFRVTLNDMAPQNQRSLTAIIRLLHDLLDGTGNDGDKGILTAAFAEILVSEGNPNDFISLIDRFIEDIELLFPIQEPSGLSTPAGSISSKHRSINATGSLNANTSLRKRFGFGPLARENSKSEKSENESKVSALWRSLSKNTQGSDSQPPSLSRAGHAHLGRSNSTDSGHMRISPRRPSSRDRPTVLGAFPFENHDSPQGRSWVGGASLESIGEVPTTSGRPRKKRRSSLSDLIGAQSANLAPAWTPQTPQRNLNSQPPTSQTTLSPETPSPPKLSHIPTPARFGSPLRKENSPANQLDRINSVREKSPAKEDEVTIKSYGRPKRRTDSISASNIPTLKSVGGNAGLSERPTSGNTVKLPPSTPSRTIAKPTAKEPPSTPSGGSLRRPPSTPSGANSVRIPPSTPRLQSKIVLPAATPRRLKLQSPQKLRERLQTQQRDIDDAGSDLQAELSAIGHELSSRTGRPHASSISTSSISSAPMGGVEARLAMLENRVRTTLDSLSTRTAAVTTDVTSSLQVSEGRCKELDQLLRTANLENDALYGRFNEELEKFAKSARMGKAAEEVQRQMREQNEELARLRKENARLKREVAGLKAQLRE